MLDAEYEYTPLPDARTHIRLIKVLEAQQAETVHFQVAYVRIVDAPEYIAISYTWGDPDSATIVKANELTMRVRSNCEYVLRQAFNFDPNRFYWIDAICIDQSDDAEKGKQVAMMGDIFYASQLVLSCLGPHADHSELLFEVVEEQLATLDMVDLRQYHEKPASPDYEDEIPSLLYFDESAISEWRPRTPKERQCFWKWFRRVRSSTYSELQEAVQCLMKRPYFGRAWIVQEVALARTIWLCCGMDTCAASRWYNMLCLLKFEGNIGVSRPAHLSVSEHIRWATSKLRQRLSGSSPTPQLNVFNHDQFLSFAFSQRKHYISMYTLVSHMVALQCFDARDRIYGTLKLVAWNKHKPIQPDYNIPPFELGVDVLGHILLESDPQTTHSLGTIEKVMNVLSLDIPYEGIPIDKMMTRRQSSSLSRRNVSNESSMARMDKGAFVARGRPLACRAFSEPILWYRNGFEPQSVSPSRFTGQSNVADEQEIKMDKQGRQSAPTPTSSDGREVHRLDSGILNSLQVDSSSDFKIWLGDTGHGSQLSLIARKLQVPSNFYTIVGYILDRMPEDRLAESTAFVIYSEPRDILRLALVSRKALAWLRTEQIFAVADVLDGLGIFRSLGSSFTIR